MTTGEFIYYIFMFGFITYIIGYGIVIGDGGYFSQSLIR